MVVNQDQLGAAAARTGQLHVQLQRTMMGYQERLDSMLGGCQWCLEGLVVKLVNLTMIWESDIVEIALVSVAFEVPQLLGYGHQTNASEELQSGLQMAPMPDESGPYQHGWHLYM